MSPLRRYMTEHGMPSWYSWVVVVLLPVFTSTAILIICLRVNQRSIDREHAAVAKSAAATDAALCSLVAPIDDGYRAVPPATQSGKVFAANVARARAKFCH